jgi:L-aspartate oxidase
MTTGPVTAIHTSDPVVIGSGVAGLTAALGLGSCLVLTKTELAEGSSRWAQGGIAAAVGGDDDPALHAADTVRVSGGLGDPIIAGLVTRSAPERIAWLQRLGAEFDTDDGRLTLGREAGHGRHRIIHADGDATGAELMRTLRKAVVAAPDIEVWEHTLAVDLLMDDGRVAGVLVQRAGGELLAISAPAVVLATGGIGRVYSRTTNPAEVTGDGFAMAARAGARLRDPEFVQFHPTALDSPLDPMPLLTEALRGAGAALIDDTGSRFMVEEHPDAELAPRDIVARANWRRRSEGHAVLLDATHLGPAFPDRFPTVFASAMDAGIDPRVRPMPVSPAAHYHMGGIAVDTWGRTSLRGLYAVGETAATGLHGANRLASNSLLEGLVFGARVADDVSRSSIAAHRRGVLTVPVDALALDGEDLEATAALRRSMWDHAGVVRDAASLSRAATTLDDLEPRLRRGPVSRNLMAVAAVVIEAALARQESRGGHFRRDFPTSDPARQQSTIVAATRARQAALPSAHRGVA